MNDNRPLDVTDWVAFKQGVGQPSKGSRPNNGKSGSRT